MYNYVAIGTAIVDRWNADAALLAASKLYFNAAPEGDKRAYTTMMFIDAETHNTMSDQSNDTLLQFSVWSPNKMSAVEANEIGLLIMGRFDWQEFSIPGQTLVWFKRVGQRVFEDPDGGFQFQIDYSVLTEES